MGHGLEKAFQVAFPQAWASRHHLHRVLSWGNPRQPDSDVQPKPAESQPRGLGVKQPRKFNKLKISSTENPGLCISSKEL